MHISSQLSCATCWLILEVAKNLGKTETETWIITIFVAIQVHSRRKRRELQAPAPDGAEAWTNLHAGAWNNQDLLVYFSRLCCEIQASWLCSCLQHQLLFYTLQALRASAQATMGYITPEQLVHEMGSKLCCVFDSGRRDLFECRGSAERFAQTLRSVGK